MNTELPYDVLTGTPEPTRRRWQPLRAGILNLFRYDAQTFVFHNGRLLLRGNNGSGKSMAVEVLIPYVLDADLSPQRLSTFGGRDRGMFLWLLGYEKPATRTNARAYVWVEFGRRRPDSGAEYFTAGAGLEALRSDASVKAFYWTTAARVGVHLDLGGPGLEPLTRQALAAQLAEHSAAGLPGQMHPDAKSHRRAVNEALYGLHERRFDALRATLLQLRRPKLSDKLNEESLNLILRNSLAPISTTIVQDLAEGFERLDRHAAAVDEVRGTMQDLRTLQASYQRYARVAGCARADAVIAAERAIRTARERAAAAQATIDSAEAELARIEDRRAAIGERKDVVDGQQEALRHREEYRQGQTLEPLRELVARLDAEVTRLQADAEERSRIADGDARSSTLAGQAAAGAATTAANARFEAEAAAVVAAVDKVNRALAASVDRLRARDVEDEEALHATVAEARALVASVTEQTDAWAGTVEALRQLHSEAREDEERVRGARSETERAEGDVREAEESLNEQMTADHQLTLGWIDALTAWANACQELSTGQAAPLPWDPAAALERAPRWAREAYDARSAQLSRERSALETSAAGWESTARAWDTAARRLDDLAKVATTACEKTDAHGDALRDHRTKVLAWAGDLNELPLGRPPLDWASLSLRDLHAAATDWAGRAATARGEALAADAARLDVEVGQAHTRVAVLDAERERLTAPGLPSLPVPLTRGAPRDTRAGAPFYLLVDFVAGIADGDQRAIEAAAIGSGIADAWVSPDGRLLSGPDGRPLLDTQLAITAEAPTAGTGLGEALVPDADCERAGVPTPVVAALLDRITLAKTAQHGPDGLVIGRDGSWRAGALTGAHTVTVVTLIGAANRETDRRTKLAQVERNLEAARRDAAKLAERRDSVKAALDILRREQADLPGDEQVRDAAEAAWQAVAAVRAGVLATDEAIGQATQPPTGPVQPTDEITAAVQDLHSRWSEVSAAVADAPSEGGWVEIVRSLSGSAEAVAAGWQRAAATMRHQAAAVEETAAAARRERDAMPDAQPVLDARATLDAARRDLESARRRLADRQKEETTARRRADDSAAALAGGLRAAGLPEDADPRHLGDALRRYRTQAQLWLSAETDAVRSAGAAVLAAVRSVESAQQAAAAKQTAAERRSEHRTKQATLQSLSDTYGVAYADIVRQLDRLEAEARTLDTDLTGLTASELNSVAQRATAQGMRQEAERIRKEADQARTAAGSAFLAAVRLGLLAAAGLPDAPVTSGDTPSAGAGDEQEPTQSGLGVRALRDWATAVRDAVGDRTVRTVQAVEQAANRVTETRHSLEPRLAGRVTVRDEQQDQLLVLHVNRAGRTFPLHEVITSLGEELARDSELLARHEAELFRKFLAGETRREVTTKVRDARTTIKAMTDLMAAHPTGSGIRVRPRWVADEKNAPGMQDVVALMAKDAPLESEKERLQAFFRQRIDRVRAGVDADWTAQLTELLDYRQWWRFQLEYRRTGDDGWTPLNSKTHGALSGGEKAVCLHLPLFAAAATYCDSASVRTIDIDGRDTPGCPRLIVLDEVFAGVDEDNRGALFDIVRTLDLDMVATSESEQGFYPQLDGIAVYHLVTSDTLDCVLATRTVWDGRAAHRILDTELLDTP